MTYLDICKSQLPIDEGTRDRPYPDTKGKITIGVGRNLTDDGLSDEEIAYLFKNDLATAESRARALVPSFDGLTEQRKAVIVNMAFNLGWGLRAFTKMLSAVAARSWDEAADEMKNSEWYREVGLRAPRLEQHMREG